MKKIQKNLRGSFNVFSNSARQLEVPLTEWVTQPVFIPIFNCKHAGTIGRALDPFV